jgi:hypothetical protein
MSTKQASAESMRLYLIAVPGFVLVATMQVTNMILARGLAGTVPPFSQSQCAANSGETFGVCNGREADIDFSGSHKRSTRPS